jgi:hypothetical protein
MSYSWVAFNSQNKQPFYNYTALTNALLQQGYNRLPVR